MALTKAPAVNVPAPLENHNVFLSNRPLVEMLERWAAGEGDHWQAHLWRELRDQLTVPGPVTIVYMADMPKSPMGGLRAASTPSCVTTGWPTQRGSGGVAVFQVRWVASIDSGSGSTGVAVTVAFELRVAPTELLTTTE